MARYKDTHPFRSFQLDLRSAPPDLWLLLGEARSKCEHLAGVPLRPDTAAELHLIYLAKGVSGTNAIEGNTLSEAQVRQRIEGELELPPSKEYLAQETDNIVAACGEIWRRAVSAEERFVITPKFICELNAQVLNQLKLRRGVTPGKFRDHAVGVGSYRAPDFAETPQLVARLCSWLAGDAFESVASHGVVRAILSAIMAHLYLAWIHPFGDGNGRTARLVEYALLVSAGVPSPAAHLLSNHYNETRSDYYRQLDEASLSNGDVVPFIHYAVQGFVDGLKAQLDLVRAQQLDVTWRNFVHERFRDATGPEKRRRDLVLDISRYKQVLFEDLVRKSRRLYETYSKLSSKTLSRDINFLVEQNLLLSDGKSLRANKSLIEAFLPIRSADKSAKKRAYLSN